MDNENTAGQTPNMPVDRNIRLYISPEVYDLQTEIIPKHKGLFLVLEGGEGTGKSSQAKLLSEAFGKMGIPTRLTREPGDTELGSELRKILLSSDREPLSQKAEALLFAADRAQHVDKVIRPALDRGEVVICDRYIASTMAYQSHAGGLPAKDVRAFSDWASGGLVADATYLLDLDPVFALQRAKRVDPNRFEEKTISYHDKVRRGFLREYRPSWMVVNAENSLHEVHRTIFKHALDLYRKTRLASTRSRVGPFCPVCDFEMRSDPEDRLVYHCENGHGKIVLQPSVGDLIDATKDRGWGVVLNHKKG